MQNKQKLLVVPKSKPRNPFGLVRKSTVKHKDKRKETKEDRAVLDELT